jgi:hypothetical protein
MINCGHYGVAETSVNCVHDPLAGLALKSADRPAAVDV